MDKGGTYELLDLEMLPSKSLLGVELKHLEGSFPHPEFDPGNRLSSGRSTKFTFQGSQAERTIGFEVKLLTGSGSPPKLLLKAIDARQAKSTPLIPDQVRSHIQAIVAQRSVAEAKFKQYSIANKKDKQAIEQAKEQLSQIQSKWRDEERVCELVLELCEAFEKEGKLHYRVFLKVDDREVDIARSYTESE